MDTTASRSSADNITPAVHLEFIQNQLENASASATDEIEKYHRALFLHRHAIELEKYRQQARTHEDRLSFLEAQLKTTKLRLSERSKLVAVTVDGREDITPRAPWNGWDIAMFVAASLGILGLITFGVLNISFNLLESGFITFRDSPIRSYFWAALLPVGALSVKIGWDFLEGSRTRDRYLWTSLALGLIGVLVWVGAYACVYPTLSKSINEQIASLTVFDNGPAAAGKSRLDFAGAKWVDVITVAGQAIAEIFLSAVLGIYLTNLYARHRPVRLAYDPAFTQLEQERGILETSIARERAGLGEATGNLVRLENQLSALIAYGKSMFHRESARRQDQSLKRQVILDQLSEHVRTHIESGGRIAANAATSAPQTSNGDGT